MFTKSQLPDEPDSGRDLSFLRVGLAKRSARALWNLKEVCRPHQSEALGLVLLGLRSYMGWILPRIGIKMESVRVQGFRETVKKRYGFLPQRCRAPVGCLSWKILVRKTLS